MNLMNNLTVQDVFWKFYPDYLDKYTPSFHQHKTAINIINCKTGAYGTNVSVCDDCGSTHLHYNSCRNRCCPMCQALPKEKWMDLRREDVLDAPYFHVVFTVPEELNPIIYSNQKLLYDALYHSVSGTLDELASDPKHLGAKIGYMCILHTWGSEMNYHPHIHVIVLGGGLDSKMVGGIMALNFSSLFVFFLKVPWKIYGGAEIFMGKQETRIPWFSTRYRNHYAFKELINSCYEKEWIPYSKETFNGAGSIIQYLGKYTHRIAISNYRLIQVTDTTVTFSVKDYKNQGQWKELTLAGIEFIRRFLMHVPPKRFVRIRHYGILSSRTKQKKLTLCRNLLGCRKYISEIKICLYQKC